MCKSVEARPNQAGFSRSGGQSVSVAYEAEAQRPKAKMGRPSTFTQERAKEIVDHISGGGHVSKLVEQGIVPNTTTLARWMRQNEDFREAVARAQEERAELWADQLIEIADTDEDPNRARVRIDARWKVIGSLLYRRYGVKQQVDINQNINVAVIQAEQLMQLSQRGRNAIDVTPTVLKTVEKIDKSNT
jgi:ADP-ribose pyrophosphatase YjhB (NUDIX family)